MWTMSMWHKITVIEARQPEKAKRPFTGSVGLQDPQGGEQHLHARSRRDAVMYDQKMTLSPASEGGMKLREDIEFI